MGHLRLPLRFFDFGFSELSPALHQIRQNHGILFQHSKNKFGVLYQDSLDYAFDLCFRHIKRCCLSFNQLRAPYPASNRHR